MTAGIAGDRVPSPNVLALLLVLTGGALRLLAFDMMEFKYDEVRAIELTEYWLARGIPQFGMMSGVGVRNPPGFIFFLAPVVHATSSAIAIALAIAALNIMALWVIYRVGCRLGCVGAGLWACGLMAAHPWLILYSRKIWAQSLLPFLVAMLLLVVAHCLARPRSAAVFWLGPLVSLLWQTHYSAYAVLVFAAAWVLVEMVRGRINRLMLEAGLLAGVVLVLPYFAYLCRTVFADAISSMQMAQSESWRLDHLLGCWIRTAFAGGFGHPFAFRPTSLADALPGAGGAGLHACGIMGTVMVVGAVLYGLAPDKGELPGRTFDRAGDRRWLALLLLLPPLLYWLKRVPAEPHYFIVGLPALLLLAGLGMARFGALVQRGTGFAKYALAGLLPGVVAMACGALVWLGVLATIVSRGGTGGDYGLGFRVQEDAAELVASKGIAAVKIDMRMMRDSGVGIAYILRGLEPAAGKPAFGRAVLVDTLLHPGLVLEFPARDGSSALVGPLAVIFQPDPAGDAGKDGEER